MSLFVSRWIFRVGMAVVFLGVAVVGCGGDRDSSTASPTAVLRCTTGPNSAFEVALRIKPDTLRATLPDRFSPRTRLLTREQAAHGARYRGDGLLVWMAETDTRVEVDGRAFADCTHQRPAAARSDSSSPGVRFRAVGQEPGWILKISASRLHFEGDYGQRTVSVPRSAVVVDSTTGRRTYRADRLTVVVEDTLCTDAMSGEPFSHAVTVTVDGDAYRGCGRFRP
jgi:putative lipoprotein